jgi:hypothetical protein
MLFSEGTNSFHDCSEIRSVLVHTNRSTSTYLDLWRVGALDVWQWVQVELLLQCLGEQDSEFSVVDKLRARKSANRHTDSVILRIILLTGIPKSTAARREA